MVRTMIVRMRVLAVVLLGLLAGGCTGFSPRPQNAVRTLLHLPIGSPEDTPDVVEANLDAFTHSRSTTGNHVTILQNGDEAFPQMIAAIDAARSHIFLTTYDFRSDQTGRRFADALERALERGIEVRLVYDAIGSRDYKEDILKPLTKKGLQLRVFNPSHAWTLLRYNNRSHRKILVADGCTAFIGGLNIGDNYTGDGLTGWRDMALMVKGPAAAEAQQVFLQGWQQAGTGWVGKNPPILCMNWLKRCLDAPLRPVFADTDARPISPADCRIPCNVGEADAPAQGAAPSGGIGYGIPVRVVEQSPEWADSHVLNLHLALINAAKQNVYIVSPYFVPPTSLLRALTAAAGRGVDVRLLTQETTDEPFVQTLSRQTFQRIVEKGVKVYGWQVSVLHAKALFVDGEWATVGSCNLDGRALFLNYEANFVVRDRLITEKLSQQFLKDIARSRQYTFDECKQMRTPTRLLWIPLRGQF